MNINYRILIICSIITSYSATLAENKLFDQGLNTQIKGHTIKEMVELLKNPENAHLDMLVVEAFKDGGSEVWREMGTLKTLPQYQRYKYDCLLYATERNQVMYCENINAIIFSDSIPLNCTDCEKMLLKHQYEKRASIADRRLYNISRRNTEINEQIIYDEKTIQIMRQHIEELLLQKKELEQQKLEILAEKKALRDSHIVIRD